jgi:Anti-sigma-K factor rskA
MLTRGPAQLDSALAGLAPGDRALLELSLRRHVSDGEIAVLLRVDAHDVERRRREALHQLADDLHLSSTEELTDLLTRSWDGGAQSSPGHGAPATNGAQRAPVVLEPGTVRRRRLMLLLTILAVAAAGAIALALAGGGEQAPSHPAAPSSPAPKPAVGSKASLAPVGTGQRVRGTAQLRGSTLSVRVQGLPPANAEYQVWLFDSVADAKPVGLVHDGRLDARLPSGFARYRFLDISREPRDGNPNHSGASVLRAPISALTP